MVTEETQSADEDHVIWLKEEVRKWTWSLDCFVNNRKIPKYEICLLDYFEKL